MYIHIGGDMTIDDRDILFILPRRTALESYDTRRCISGAIGQGRVIEVYRGQGESYIICAGDKSEVFLSPVSSVTLTGRKA